MSWQQWFLAVAVTVSADATAQVPAPARSRSVSPPNVDTFMVVPHTRNRWAVLPVATRHCEGDGPRATVVITVVDDSTGEPIEDAQFGVTGTRCFARGGPHGRFVVTGVPAGDQRLSVRRLGYAVTEFSLHLPPDQVTEIHIRAWPKALILDGPPPHGFGRVLPADSPRSPSGAPGPAIESDSSTKRHVPATAPWGWCRVAVGTVLTGRVIDDSAGRPLAGVGVSAVPGCIARTNAAGEYTLGPVGVGLFEITVDDEKYDTSTKPWVRTRAVIGGLGSRVNMQDIRVKRIHCIDAGPVAHIVGRVVDDSTGKPIPGAQAGFVSTPCTAVTRADGQFEILSVPAGMQTLTIRRVGYAVAEIQVDLRVDDVNDVSVRMRRAPGFFRAGSARDAPEGRGQRQPADSARLP